MRPPAQAGSQANAWKFVEVKEGYILAM
jgi:hypothetical protein